MNDKQMALEEDQRAEERAQRRHGVRCERAAMEDEAALAALNAQAFALHVRVPVPAPAMFDGAALILWNGWLEDWAEFYGAHRAACVGLGSEDGKGEPLSPRARARLGRYREVLAAFCEWFELSEAFQAHLEVLPSRSAASETVRVVRFVLEHRATVLRFGMAYAKIDASESQYLRPFPSALPPASFRPVGPTRH